MKKHFLIIICFIIPNFIFSQAFKQAFIAEDIENFWQAYDSITATKDTLLQQKYLKELYLDKGTDGLKSLITVRNYTQKDFLDNLSSSPEFWHSIRENTLSVKALYAEIEYDIEKLRAQYPALKPIPIYFAIGAFRTNGTIHENKILIGSEYAVVDETTVVLDDLPKTRHAYYTTFKPRKNIALLVTHEYIHTQQKELVHNLLSYCLYEGIAEFISCKVTGKISNSPAIAFGKTNQNEVVRQFVKDLYIGDNVYNWLWGANSNQLKERDLGYYIGYEIAERYYNQSTDKKKAMQELIELDYTNENEVEKLVDQVRLLPKTLNELYSEYETQRPKVLSVKPFKNGAQNVDPQTTQLTIEFSEPMDERYSGFDFGDLGKEHAVQIKSIAGWSGDKKSLAVEINQLKTDRKYQLKIQNFRDRNGRPIKDYLIAFKTRKR